MHPRTALCLSPWLLFQAHALVHQQVAFDSSDVCWWGLVPPDLVCPVLAQQNLTDLVNKLAGRYEWERGDRCEDGFCLYANRGFAGGRGIALITTEPNYIRVKAVGDLLQEHDVSFNKDHTSLPFHLGHADGKGKGILADRPLQRGDPVMAHTPVLLVHRAFIQDLPPARQHALLDQAVHSLPLSTAELFLNQTAHSHSSQQQQQHRRAVDLLVANAFQVNLNLDRDVSDHSAYHYAAYPEAARMSHDCRPDAAFYVDPATLMHITTAVRGIKPGEEITLSYLDPLASHEERREHALAAWGHGCGCHQCSADEEDVEDSETRLSEIKWIESRLEDGTSTEVSTGLITYLLGLYENERLHCCLAGAYALVARNFNMLGYGSQAVTYAGLAIEAIKIEKGENTPEIKELRELSRDPKGHPTWKSRVRKPADPVPPGSTAAPTPAPVDAVSTA